MDKDHLIAYAKIFILWLVTGVEWLTAALPKIALLLTCTFTCLQLYVLWRDKLRPPKTPKE